LQPKEHRTGPSAKLYRDRFTAKYTRSVQPIIEWQCVIDARPSQTHLNAL
jgi:hypothetical protein